MYEDGVGTERSAVDAVTWYTKAAEAGDAEGQYRLGLCCLNGVGRAADRAQALRWLNAASDQGHVAALDKVMALTR